MKFIKWLTSLFIPTECKVEYKPKEKDTLRKLLDKGVSSFELSEYLGTSLLRMLSNVYTMYPETTNMCPQDVTEFVLDKFKEDYPDVEVGILEHNEDFIEFNIYFSGKEVNFRCDYDQTRGRNGDC